MMPRPDETGPRSIAASNPACSICGTLNSDNAEFCRCCGVSITRASEHVAQIEDSGFCETCHSVHATPARFCDQCGGKLPGYVRPPDLSSERVREVAGTQAADIMKTMPVSANVKARGASRPVATVADRRLTAMHYLIMPTVFAAAVVGMYFSGYRITQVHAGGFVPLQANVSVPARVLHSAATPLPLAESDAMKDPVSFDERAVGPAQAEPAIENGAQADTPVLPVPHAARPTGRLLRPAMPRVDAEEAYEEPISEIRELPAMPVHDFKSIMQFDAARN